MKIHESKIKKKLIAGDIVQFTCSSQFWDINDIGLVIMQADPDVHDKDHNYWVVLSKDKFWYASDLVLENNFGSR